MHRPRFDTVDAVRRILPFAPDESFLRQSLAGGTGLSIYGYGQSSSTASTKAALDEISLCRRNGFAFTNPTRPNQAAGIIPEVLA